MLDDLTEAVLSREDIVRYLHGSHGESGLQVRDRIFGYWRSCGPRSATPSTGR